MLKPIQEPLFFKLELFRFTRHRYMLDSRIQSMNIICLSVHAPYRPKRPENHYSYSGGSTRVNPPQSYNRIFNNHYIFLYITYMIKQKSAQRHGKCFLIHDWHWQSYSANDSDSCSIGHSCLLIIQAMKRTRFLTNWTPFTLHTQESRVLIWMDIFIYTRYRLHVFVLVRDGAVIFLIPLCYICNLGGCNCCIFLFPQRVPIWPMKCEIPFLHVNVHAVIMWMPLHYSH